ncbi:MAG: hypothetical protein PUF31_04100 [Oscillospiraceae bacterium]|nr:hypothetical protein [Oscillospiraceae bacterium]
MEYLRTVYEQLVKYDPFSFTLCFTKAHNIIENLENKDTFISTDRKLSKGEEYILGAKRIKDVTLETGKIVDIIKDYVYGYQDLSYEEFISYIFWRTQIRKRKTVFVPSGFLALYLIEIVNFVEIDKVEDGLEIIKFLELLSADMESNLRQIKKAREEFLLYYGTVEDTKSIIDYSNFDYLFEDDKIINKNHPALLECFCNRHYTAFLRSKMFLQHSKELECNFQIWFYDLTNYLSLNGIDFLDLYYGSYTLHKLHKVYIKNVIQEKVIEKCIEKNGVCIVRTNCDVEIGTKFCTDGTQKNKEQSYIRWVVIRYILRLYENKMRRILNYPKNYPRIAELQKGFCKSEVAIKLANIFASDEFSDLFMSTSLPSSDHFN